MERRRIELLAPAKNKDVAKAAIDCGADAVYIGASRFGARSAAGNSVEDIAQVVYYAHRFGARVYVTLNTLLRDDELEEAEKLVNELYKVGVDALIVQDMGLLRMNIPPIALHASTQCDIRTVEKARFLQSVGFSQLVLARELTSSEISEITQAVEVPVEVFVHGALCVSYSGRCAISHTIKGRSANRGECAQLCRLSYDLIDGTGKILKRKKHLLSLRDMNQSDNIEKLLDAGASSFKIEGRLKDADYVCNVVAAYRMAIDKIIGRRHNEFVRSSYGHSEYGFMPQLDKSFNRSFTHYFLENRRPQDMKMASFDTPKSLGECVGRVKSVRVNVVVLDGNRTINNGDGLSYFNSDGDFDGFRANSVSGNRINAVSQNRITLSVGDMVYRTYDKEFNDNLKKPITRTFRLDFALEKRGETVVLSAKDEAGNRAEVLVAQIAGADKNQEESQRRVLMKVGNTCFSIGEICTLDDCFVPASVLANARREVLVKLEQEQQHRLPDGFRNDEDRDVAYPDEKLIFSDNVANRLSEAFYRSHGVKQIEPAAEVQRELRRDAPLMTTRYCLRRELGCCKRDKTGGNLTEPLKLIHSGMPTLKLHFDCSKCEMQVMLDADR